MNYFYIMFSVVSFLLIYLYNSYIRLLNDNLLEGRVPDELFSVGVHGGSIEYVVL